MYSNLETIKKIVNENGLKVLDIRDDGSNWEPINTLYIVVEAPKWLTLGLIDYVKNANKDTYVAFEQYCSILSKCRLQIENLLKQAKLDYDIIVDII